MRWAAWALCLLLLAMSLGGCARPQQSAQEEADGDQSVMATFYPLYAIAVNLVRDVPELSLSCLVQPQDGCLRSYSLSEWDYLILASQDAVICGGRGLESFSGTLSALQDGPILISCLQGLTLKNDGEAQEEESHLQGENPFPFLSVGGAMSVATTIAYSLMEIDPEYADLYQKNLQDYLARLDELAGQMADVLARAPGKRVALMNEGLSYLADQLALNVVAQIDHEPGVSVEDNDLEAVLSQLEEADAEVVLLESQAPMHLVEALEGAGYRVALLDILSAHPADGDLYAYERMMLENSERVAEALRG